MIAGERSARVNPGKARQAFTVVELVVTIGIVMVLAGLFLGAASRTRTVSDDVKCVSNLRQIGMGTIGYAHDHDETLPGPLYIGVFPWWTDTVALSWRIQKYIDVDPNQFKTRDDVFICPAYAKVTKDYRVIPDYMLNGQVRMRGDELLHQPFGYPEKQILGTKIPVYELVPLKIFQLGDICDSNGIVGASKVWAVKDCDGLDSMMRNSSYYKQLPKTMLHNGHRNALFFDFHVGRVGLNNEPI